ncbi:sugar phosphate isomerase/epimerase family protein [Adhaeribacter rhizoryzae]|uniref:TIM barrel protein n=1 Tax=Adhaeribacter rhizoryzae TaxID=2607907 RepID=A0A5M6DB99_9BACT|nr:sugar phosphate isomerase/epimerase [Adhaeribacter rhizoryzae]KAA5544821.1 TIM barrel protein [Adhaeribacter rhizoryzae]
MSLSRKDFMKVAGLGLAAGLVPAATVSAFAQATPAKNLPIPLGLASYTMHKFSLDDTLKYSKRIGLTHIALKDVHLPLTSTPEQISEAVAKVKAAGLNLYGAGVIYMKSEEEVKRAFNYAKLMGIQTIIGVPNYELLPLVDKLVKEQNIKLAIHNHGPGDKVYPSPDTVYERIKSFDKRIGLCIDIGHTVRIGQDPAKMAQKYADRLYDVHLKDVTGNTGKDSPLEIGRGVIDIPGFLRTLVKIKYQGVLGLEYEKDANDPVPGLAESVGYTRGVFRMLA